MPALCYANTALCQHSFSANIARCQHCFTQARTNAPFIPTVLGRVISLGYSVLRANTGSITISTQKRHIPQLETHPTNTDCSTHCFEAATPAPRILPAAELSQKLPADPSRGERQYPRAHVSVFARRALSAPFVRAQSLTARHPFYEKASMATPND